MHKLVYIINIFMNRELNLLFKILYYKIFVKNICLKYMILEYNFKTFY
jgi:hypothetical protein